MADWRDVMNARHEADDALTVADAFGGAIQDGRTPDAALAFLLSARAIALELRALGTTIDYGADRVRV